MKQDPKIQLILKAGFTLILLAYFLVWLPQPVAGLSFIGLELGEWVKFLPQVQAGKYITDRILFYLPPITLGILLSAWTIGWSNRRWQTWVVRAIAVAISLLAFPPLESIRYESTDQWLSRVMLVILVVVIALLSGMASRLPQRQAAFLKLWIFIIAGLLGAVLPAWTYLAMRPDISVLFGESVSIGPGLWLNAIGHLLVAGVGGFSLYKLTAANSQNTSTALDAKKTM